VVSHKQKWAIGLADVRLLSPKIELGERRLDAAEFVKVSRAIGADPYEIMREADAD
jgi:hypothetical protein